MNGNLSRINETNSMDAPTSGAGGGGGGGSEHLKSMPVHSEGQITITGIQDEYKPYGNEFPSYPPPKRPGMTGGRSDLLDTLLSNVNQDLLIAKTFYFFFFSAFGSLFPLMAIFFKQLGMNPLQCGLLSGFRPLVEFLSAPFWNTIADAYQKGKQILLFSLMCWIVFTLTLCFISPPAASCIVFNKTHHILRDLNPQSEDDDVYVEKRDVRLHPEDSNVDDDIDVDVVSRVVPWTTDGRSQLLGNTYSDTPIRSKRRRTKMPPGHVIGQSPGPVHFTVNYDPDRHRDMISPVFSTIVYRREDVRNAFFVILLLVVAGEFFSAPAITLADSVTLTYLGENANNYGKQRMFGSLGWGLSMFFVGIALDHSTVFSYHPCGPHERERNYTICFAVFSVLMGAAFLTATQLRFDYDAFDDTIPMRSMGNEAGEVQDTRNKSADDKQSADPPCPLPPPQSSVGVDRPPNERKPEKSTVFASKAREIPEWWRVLRTFANLRYGSFLFVAWFMGVGVGLVFTFLFWHLQDLGGTPTLFGVASVINHISEIFAYFFSFRLIRQIGHVRVLCLGLLGNLARFLYISWLHNPWWVLPFEFIQGVTHAAVWAACCSYITQATPTNLRSSAQGVLQGLHHGIGRGCGAVVGGLIATYSGTAVLFRTYSFICLLVLIAFVFINYYRPDTGFASAESVEPKQVLEESSHLAPHGVPSGPMPRALSSSRLEEMGVNGNGAKTRNPQSGYGSVADKKGNGQFLDLPNYGGGGGGNYVGEQETDTPASPTSIVYKTDLDYIRDNFKAYQDAMNYFGGSDSSCSSYKKIIDGDDSQLLTAPAPKTVTHALQPRNSSTYEW